MSILDDRIQAKGGPLFGLQCYFYSPILIDIAARLGYDSIWVEMEHGHIAFSQTADLCRIASGLGLLTMIRIPDARRENVLKAAECAPDIIDLPMANTPEIVEELVSHALYSPEGNRGFFGSSRAVRYTIDTPIVDEQRRVNRELCLMAQIETIEAVDRADEICSVPGINAIFLGPGDMSASLGVTGELNHPTVKEALERAIATAKRYGKRVAMASAASDVAYWADKGVELFYCASDVTCLKQGAQEMLDEARGAL